MSARTAAGPVGSGAQRKGEALSNPSVAESCTSASQGVGWSFRWEVEGLDMGFTPVPDIFLDTYAEAGLTPTEFQAITHLARYRWERKGSESRPAVSTLARQMGMTRRGVHKILAGLEARGFLKRHQRAGKTTVYAFGGLSRALMRIHRERAVSG